MAFFVAKHIQGRHGELEPDKAHSTVVGIIYPPLVEIGLGVTQNLGKARALEALVAVAALTLMETTVGSIYVQFCRQF